MNGRVWLVTGSLLAALDVALAAYGAHGLKETLERIVPEPTLAVAGRETSDAPAAASPGRVAVASGAKTVSRDEEIAKRLANFDTAARYQMYHALGLVTLGLLAARGPSRWFTTAGWLFLGGVAIFSGLLYGLVFSGPKILGAIVPIGGLAMILGWVALAAGAWRISPTTNGECP
jgi:uncharacterized membrane protein YgdD (TMEM256/DUF423 family)